MGNCPLCGEKMGGNRNGDDYMYRMWKGNK